MSTENIEKALEEAQKLLNEIEADRSLTKGPAIQVNEENDLSSLYLSEGAQNVMKNKAFNQTVVKNDGTTFTAMYFAKRVRKDNKESAVKELALIMNELVQDGLVDSMLAPISSLELALQSFEVPSIAVFFFPLVPADEYDRLFNKYRNIAIVEGQMPDSADDLRQQMSDGEFLAQIRISPMHEYLNKNYDTYRALSDQIDTFLAVLPKGTQLVYVKETAINDLSLPYEVKFYNPLMKSVKYVELDHTRVAERIGDDKVEQFNLLTKVKYLDFDRKELYT